MTAPNPGTPAPVQMRIRMEHATHDEQRSFDITVTNIGFESPAKCLAEAMATVFRDPLGVAEIKHTEGATRISPIEGPGEGKEVTPVPFPHPIIIDTREQLPFAFAGIPSDAKEGKGFYAIDVVRQTLQSGDYSIDGLQEIVAVERKSLADLFSTIGQGRDRFVRELERLSSFRYAAIVFEGTWDDVVLAPPEHTRLTGKTVHRSIVAWQQRYPRVHWWACGNRRFAEITTFRILKRAIDEHVKALKAVKPGTSVKVNDLAGDCIELLRLNDQLDRATTQAERRWVASSMIDRAVEIARSYLRKMEVAKDDDN